MRRVSGDSIPINIASNLRQRLVRSRGLCWTPPGFCWVPDPMSTLRRLSDVARCLRDYTPNVPCRSQRVKPCDLLSDLYALVEGSFDHFDVRYAASIATIVRIVIPPIVWEEPSIRMIATHAAASSVQVEIPKYFEGLTGAFGCSFAAHSPPKTSSSDLISHVRNVDEVAFLDEIAGNISVNFDVSDLLHPHFFVWSHD